MGQTALSRWIRAIIVFLALAGCAGFGVFAYILKGLKWVTTTDYAVWLSVIALALAPCYAVLVILWGVCATVKNGTVFCEKNAGRLRAISFLAGADSVFFFAANTALLVFELSNTYLFCASLVAVITGVVIAAASAILSHFCVKAADLQDQSDLTI